MKLLILGDIYGSAGLNAAQINIPLMRKQLSPDLVIVNAENVSEGGKSLSMDDYNRLMAAGVDYITMGNHTFKHDDIEEILETKDNIIRPAN
jgi:calcineurin-like phosphoesterase